MTPGDVRTLTVGVASSSPRIRARLLCDCGQVVRTTSADVLKQLGVQVGHEQEAESLLAAVAGIELEVATARALRLLEYRERSAGDLTARLAADGYPDTVVASVVTKAVDSGLVDDARYADLVIRSKLAAGWGRRRIADALRNARIDDELAAERLATADLDESAEYERALAQATRRPPTDARAVERVAARLARRGFSLDLAWRAARDAFATTTESDFPEPSS